MSSVRRWLAGLAVVGALVAVPSAQAAPDVRPAAAPAASATALAIIGTINLPGAGTGWADRPYVSADDTLYVPTQFANYVAIMNPGRTSGVMDDSLAVATAWDVVLGHDDTVFVASKYGQQVVAFAPGARTPAYTISGFAQFPDCLGINSDDTLVVSEAYGASPGGTLSFVSRNSQAVDDSLVGLFGGSWSPTDIAVDASGGFYIGSNATQAKYVPRAAVTPSRTITGLNSPTRISLTADDTLLTISSDHFVAVVPPGAASPSATINVAAGFFVTDILTTPAGLAYASTVNAGSISRIDLATGTATVVLSVATPRGLALTSTGLLYITTGGDMTVLTAAEVGASLPVTSGSAGSTVTVNVTGLPAGAQMDDSTVTSVWWGDDTLPFTRSGNAVSVIAPAGSGSVPVVLSLNGGNAVSAGSFSYPAPPAPEPPGAPSAVAATAGDASASVSWSAPTSSGSFAISTYQVESVPSGGSCLTSGLACDVAGLRNGTSYAFRARALTGAGWGPWSALSSPVTPSAAVETSIHITGSRGVVRGKPGIVVTGTTMGLGKGALVTPWFARAGGRVEEGTPTLTSTDGTFTWSRRASAKATWVVYVTVDAVRSNTVTIRPKTE